MIPVQYVTVIVSNNGAYYRKLGYGVCRQREVLQVKLKDLPKQSNKLVQAICDDCGASFERQYQLLMRQNVHRCYKCARQYVGSVNGAAEHCMELSKRQIGSNHPRWREDTPAFQKYRTRVQWLTEKTYRMHKGLINPNNYPRTLSGVDGGYQLDHIISVRKGFDNGFKPEQMAQKDNLQILPWFINRQKAAA